MKKADRLLMGYIDYIGSLAWPESSAVLIDDSPLRKL